MVRKPDKQQNIRVAVGYRLRAPEGERLEPARIRVTVEAVRRDSGEPVSYERTVTVIDASGEILVEIPGVRNLQELSQVRGFATIENGNDMKNSGVVPEDPKIGQLQSVSLDGAYRKTAGSRQGSYELTARAVLAEPVDRAVAGTLTLSQPPGPTKAFTLAPQQVQTQVTFSKLKLVEGSVAEVVAELTKNGIGTDSATWSVSRDHNLLIDFRLELEKKSSATPTSPPTYQIRGHVVAQLAFETAAGSWKFLAGAPGGGNLGFSQETGSEDSFFAGPVPLKPNAVVHAQALIDDEEATSALTAEAAAPDDEPNRIESVQLVAEPVDPKNPFGGHRLSIAFVAIIPSGEGAVVRATGSAAGEAAVAGHGTTGGRIACGTATEATTIDVSIDGGNVVTVQWKPPPPPALDESDRERGIPPSGKDPATVPPAAIAPGAARSEPPREEDKKPRDAPASVRLIHPGDQILRGSRGFLRFEVLDASHRPCPTRPVAWQFAPRPSGGVDHGDFLPWPVRAGTTGADGQLELEYACSSATANFQPGASFSETLEFTYDGQPIGAVTFFIAPPLSIRFHKDLFADTMPSVDYDASLVKSGGALSLRPTLSGEGERWLGDAKLAVQHAEIFVNSAAAPLESTGGGYLIPLGSASASQEVSFLVHLEHALDERARRLNGWAKAVDERLATRRDPGVMVGIAGDGEPGSGKAGKAAQAFLLGLAEQLAECNPRQPAGPQPRDLLLRLADTSFFLEHSIGVHRAFAAALELNRLSFKRARDNAAHVTMELLLFDPFREGLKVGVRTGMAHGAKAGIKEGTDLFAKELRNFYDDKLRKQLAESIIEQTRKQREPLIDGYRRATARIEELARIRDAARPLQETLEGLRRTLSELADDVANWQNRKATLQTTLERLRGEMKELQQRLADVPTAAQLREARQRGAQILDEMAQQQTALKTQEAKIAALTQRQKANLAEQARQTAALDSQLGQGGFKSLDDLEGALQEQLARRDALKRQLFERAASQVEAEVQKIQSQLDEANQTVSRLQQWNRQTEEAGRAVRQLQTEIRAGSTALKQLAEQREGLQRKIDELNALRSEWERVATSASAREVADRRLGQLTEEINGLREQLTVAERQLAESEAARQAALDQVQQKNGEIHAALQQAGAESVEQLSDELAKQARQQAQIAGARDALGRWHDTAQQLAQQGLEPNEILKRFVALAEERSIDQEALRRASRNVRAVTDGVSQSDLDDAYWTAFRDQVHSMLMSKYGSGEISELLARREEALQALVEEGQTKSKPILLADYEPHDWSDYFRYVSDLLKSGWDWVAEGIAGLVRSVGGSIRSAAEYFLGDVYGAALSDTLYQTLAFLFRALFGFIMFVIDLFISVAGGIRSAMEFSYEQGCEFLQTDRGRLISDLRTRAGCDGGFFYLEASNIVPAHGLAAAFTELKKQVERLLSSDAATPSVKTEFVSYTDRAFDAFANYQWRNADTVVSNLAVQALTPDWHHLPSAAGNPQLPRWDRLQLLSRTLGEYEKDFLDPSGGREFWATWGHVIRKAWNRPGELSAANLDQLVDWAAWVIAMTSRFVALVGVLSSPWTTVGGLALGAGGLAVAELADVIGAAIKTVISCVFTETAVRNYQEDVLLLQMQTYNELFDRR